MTAINASNVPVLAFLAFCGVMGLVALISPKYFARVASWSGRWIDSRKLFEVFDKRIEIDDRILPYSRILGALVLASVSVLGFCLAGR